MPKVRGSGTFVRTTYTKLRPQGLFLFDKKGLVYYNEFYYFYLCKFLNKVLWSRNLRRNVIC